jgi:16S rRNA (guanine1207-N2)-methyltransferase
MTRLFNPTSILFSQMVRFAPGDRVLLLHVDDPAFARWLVEELGPAGPITALHTSYTALRQLAAVPGLTLSEAVYPDPAAHGPADVALMVVPKGREHTQVYLWAAAQTLRPGGRLFLAGPNAGGAKTAIKDAALVFGAAPVMGYKASHRIATATRPDIVTLPPGWSPGTPQTRTISRPEGDYTIITLPGVFSWDHLDDGTALLLDDLTIKPESSVLDMGCGYGIIGLVAARAGAQVIMVDDDLLAVRCASASVEANSLAERCTVQPGDITSSVKGQKFDWVLSNPPFHRETDVTTSIAYRIIRESKNVLKPRGRLRIVANRFLPYDGPMNEIYGNVTTITETSRYRVLESRV